MWRRLCLLVVASCANHQPYDFFDAGTDAPSSTVACTGLGCDVVTTCPGGAKTTVTGTAFAPNGTLPLYGAQVYIPTQPLDAFADGVSCDRCSAISGSPLASMITGPDGTFTLENVPSEHPFPLVIQLGHWRRQVTVPAVPSCATTAITDIENTRLPRNRFEGDIPHMAIATGASDPLECLLLKLGIDPMEITAPSETGRIHFYTATDAPGTDLATPAPRASALYSSLDTLTRYDAVLLPCEGAAYDKSVVSGVQLAIDPRPLLAEYVNLGGRVFSTHYSYDWLTYASSPFNPIAAPLGANGLWPVGQADEYNQTIAGQISLDFQKGIDFASWLLHAGATSAPDQLDIQQGRHDITGVDPQYARSWVNYNFNGVGSGPGTMHFTFNTPLDAPLDPSTGEPAYCGRVVFSDFHVTAAAVSNASLPFPAACNSDPMTDQEKALAFMLFDLTACITNELE